MTENNFPEGWDQNRVQKVLARHDEQPEDEALAEDEAGVASCETVMSSSHDLVSQVRGTNRKAPRLTARASVANPFRRAVAS